MSDNLDIALHTVIRVGAGATCLVILFQYYLFARGAALGFRGAIAIFFRRLALILPAAVFVWLVLYLTIESDEAYFVIDTMFPVVIALSAVSIARRAAVQQSIPPTNTTGSQPPRP